MKRFVAAIVLATLASLSYVHFEVEAVTTGYQIRKQEETKIRILDRQRALQYNIASLQAPHNLERRLQAQKIVLQSPKSWQRLVVAGPANAERSLVKPNPLAAGGFPWIGRLFLGTAQAEAKEASAR